PNDPRQRSPQLLAVFYYGDGDWHQFAKNVLKQPNKSMASPGQRRHQTHARAAFRGWTDFKLSPDVLHALAHITQTIPPLVLVRRRQTAAIVFDLQNEPGWLRLKPKPGRGGPGVFNHVVDRLLRHQENIVPQLGRNRRIGQLLRDFEPITQA